MAADTQPGTLVSGVRLAWSAASGPFKAVLLEADPSAVDEQLSLMGDWFEVEAHDDRAFAETMMADRLECLRGTPVEYRSTWIGGEARSVRGLAMLSRFDEFEPGDDVWTWDTAGLRPVQTSNDGRLVELKDGADHTSTAPRHWLGAVFDRDGSALIERRSVTSGSKVMRVAWLIGEPVVTLVPANM